MDKNATFHMRSNGNDKTTLPSSSSKHETSSLLSIHDMNFYNASNIPVNIEEDGYENKEIC